MNNELAEKWRAIVAAYLGASAVIDWYIAELNAANAAALDDDREAMRREHALISEIDDVLTMFNKFGERVRATATAWMGKIDPGADLYRLLHAACGGEGGKITYDHDKHRWVETDQRKARAAAIAAVNAHLEVNGDACEVGCPCGTESEE